MHEAKYVLSEFYFLYFKSNFDTNFEIAINLYILFLLFFYFEELPVYHIWYWLEWKSRKTGLCESQMRQCKIVSTASAWCYFSINISCELLLLLYLLFLFSIFFILVGSCQTFIVNSLSVMLWVANLKIEIVKTLKHCKKNFTYHLGENGHWAFDMLTTESITACTVIDRKL